MQREPPSSKRRKPGGVFGKIPSHNEEASINKVRHFAIGLSSAFPNQGMICIELGTSAEGRKFENLCQRGLMVSEFAPGPFVLS